MLQTRDGKVADLDFGGKHSAVPRKDLPLTGVPGKVILAVVDKAVATRWDEAHAAATGAPGPTAEAKVAHLAQRYTRQLGALGAAAGGTAAIPAVGTMTALGATTAEIAAFTFRSTELILAIGAVHGHVHGGHEQRKAWVLSVLAFGEHAAAGYQEAAGTLGGGVVTQARSASNHWFQRVNGYLGRKILARWGARKGAVWLGHLLPFGIGAAVGGTTNLVMARAIARHADRFFRTLPTGLAALPPPPAPALPPT